MNRQDELEAMLVGYRTKIEEAAFELYSECSGTRKFDFVKLGELHDKLWSYVRATQQIVDELKLAVQS